VRRQRDEEREEYERLEAFHEPDMRQMLRQKRGKIAEKLSAWPAE
jgi:transcription initiation factor IIE alpha subunit